MNVVYTESLDATATNYGSKVGANFLLRLNAFALGRDAIPPKYAHRKSELIILRGTTQEDKIAITLPEGYEVGALPEDVVIEEQFGSYHATFRREGIQLYYTRTLKFNEGNYPVAQYENYRDFYKAVVRNDSQKVLIQKI